MKPSDRYLHFDNIDMDKPVISSRCSICQAEFAASPKIGERVDDVLLRIRVEFNAHECQQQTLAQLLDRSAVGQAASTPGIWRSIIRRPSG